MRRIVIWALSTLTVIVLLLSYHTSRSSVVATGETRPVTSGAQSAPSTTTDQGSGSAGGTGDAASDDPHRGRFRGERVQRRHRGHDLRR